MEKLRTSQHLKQFEMKSEENFNISKLRSELFCLLWSVRVSSIQIRDFVFISRRSNFYDMYTPNYNRRIFTFELIAKFPRTGSLSYSDFEEIHNTKSYAISGYLICLNTNLCPFYQIALRIKFKNLPDNIEWRTNCVFESFTRTCAL